MEVVLWDERRTTIEAHSILSAGGKKMKQHRKNVDAVAASLILEGVSSIPWNRILTDAGGRRLFTRSDSPVKIRNHSKQFFQQSQLQSQRKRLNPAAVAAAAEGGMENGLPFHLMVLAVEQQGSGGGGDKIEQVDALGDFLRERCQCGEVYHQYGAAADAKAGENAGKQPDGQR